MFEQLLGLEALADFCGNINRSKLIMLKGMHQSVVFNPWLSIVC